jgi:hypothetical protein
VVIYERDEDSSFVNKDDQSSQSEMKDLLEEPEHLNEENSDEEEEESDSGSSYYKLLSKISQYVFR